MSLAKLELAKFPTYLKGKESLETLGCSVGEPGEFVRRGGVYFARLLGDGSLEGVIPPGADGPEVRIVQGLAQLRIERYLGAKK